MSAQKVLVCGAGVSGSVCAYWLGKHGFQVVVAERSKAEQKAGQGIEIDEPALSVVKAMGVFETLDEKKTREMGFDLVDAAARSYGFLGVGDAISPTGALELMRGDLTEVLYKAADTSDNVTYRFETVLRSLRQTQQSVFVDLEDRKSKTTTTEEFDLVIGADGVRSRTRDLVMGSPAQSNYTKRLGAFVAWFSIPKEEQDLPYSQVCHFPGRRIIWLRPLAKDSDTTSVYFIHLSDDVPSLRRANAAGDRAKQKEAFADLYAGLGWQTRRVVEQMMRSDNFYSDDLIQVRLPKWSQDRVVLVGDAAWAPSPFSGEGNQLAIIGAWVLAQELSRNRSTVGFDQYEKRLRSYVEDAQRIPLGGYAPYIFVPQTSLGIWLFRMTYRLLCWVVRFCSWTKITSLLPEAEQHPKFDLEFEGSQAKQT